MNLKHKQFFTEIDTEINGEFINKLGTSVIVYINWELRAPNMDGLSKMIIKVRTNRFLKAKDGQWKRIIDFKESLSNEFYVAIDIHPNTAKNGQNKKYSIDEFEQIFGVDIKNIWKRYIDTHCSWKTEDLKDDDLLTEKDILPEYLE
jgi:hypothetical protein